MYHIADQLRRQGISSQNKYRIAETAKFTNNLIHNYSKRHAKGSNQRYNE